MRELVTNDVGASDEKGIEGGVWSMEYREGRNDLCALARVYHCWSLGVLSMISDSMRWMSALRIAMRSSEWE